MVTIDAARTEWSSADVLTGVTRLAAEGRAVTADLIALLAVLDERRLFEAEGCGSLFEFCVTRLRLSESQAYHRIQAARAAARFPVILDRLREGTVTLTSIALLRPVLTEANHAQLLRDAGGRAKREVECAAAAARGPDGWSSITACPLLTAARRPSTTSSSAADATTGPRPGGGQRTTAWSVRTLTGQSHRRARDPERREGRWMGRGPPAPDVRNGTTLRPVSAS